MSDLFENHIVGFPMRRLNFVTKRTHISFLKTLPSMAIHLLSPIQDEHLSVSAERNVCSVLVRVICFLVLAQKQCG